MVSGEISVKQGEVTLYTKGLGRLFRQLEKAGADTQEMKDLMHQIGMLIVRDARRRVPHGKNEKLAKTIRAGRGKTKAVVRAGTARTPYAGVIHYGTEQGHTDSLGRLRRVEKHPFLTRALEVQQDQALDMLETGIKNIITKNHIKLS